MEKRGKSVPEGYMIDAQLDSSCVERDVVVQPLTSEIYN